MAVVLITGCSSGGIGYSIAAEFARRGCQVFATARNTSSMAGLLELGCKLLKLDVTSSKDIAAAVATVLREAGRIDVLVNNAGVLAKAALSEAPPRHMRDVFDVNFFAATDLITAVAPHMITARSGTIINIGSISSYMSQPFWSAYSASKAALMSMSDALRGELAPFGVNVMYCAPGFIATQLDVKGRAATLNYVDPKGPYATSAKVVDFIMHTHGIKDGTPADEFARGFVDKALSSRPPAHYVTGKTSWFVWKMGCFAPLWLTDKLLARKIGLNTLVL